MELAGRISHAGHREAFAVQRFDVQIGSRPYRADQRLRHLIAGKWKGDRHSHHTLAAHLVIEREQAPVVGARLAPAGEQVAASEDAAVLGLDRVLGAVAPDCLVPELPVGAEGAVLPAGDLDYRQCARRGGDAIEQLAVMEGHALGDVVFLAGVDLVDQRGAVVLVGALPCHERAPPRQVRARRVAEVVAAGAQHHLEDPVRHAALPGHHVENMDILAPAAHRAAAADLLGDHPAAIADEELDRYARRAQRVVEVQQDIVHSVVAAGVEQQVDARKDAGRALAITHAHHIASRVVVRGGHVPEVVGEVAGAGETALQVRPIADDAGRGAVVRQRRVEGPDLVAHNGQALGAELAVDHDATALGRVGLAVGQHVLRQQGRLQQREHGAGHERAVLAHQQRNELRRASGVVADLLDRVRVPVPDQHLVVGERPGRGDGRADAIELLDIGPVPANREHGQAGDRDGRAGYRGDGRCRAALARESDMRVLGSGTAIERVEAALQRVVVGPAGRRLVGIAGLGERADRGMTTGARVDQQHVRGGLVGIVAVDRHHVADQIPQEHRVGRYAERRGIGARGKRLHLLAGARNEEQRGGGKVHGHCSAAVAHQAIGVPRREHQLVLAHVVGLAGDHVHQQAGHDLARTHIRDQRILRRSRGTVGEHLEGVDLRVKVPHQHLAGAELDRRLAGQRHGVEVGGTAAALVAQPDRAGGEHQRHHTAAHRIGAFERHDAAAGGVEGPGVELQLLVDVGPVGLVGHRVAAQPLPCRPGPRVRAGVADRYAAHRIKVRAGVIHDLRTLPCEGAGHTGQ
ncbi:hypothetical protein BV378_14235 [Nostoc sp. RF31YmG]|nr:hypothetical protein BV378_14235 [Nostoc sp. RF31YmG]